MNNSLVRIKSSQVLFDELYQIHISDLNIVVSQHTVILGRNGSGKSAVAAFIAGEGELIDGNSAITDDLACVSVVQQQALIEAEKRKDCADILDIIAVPSTVEEVLLEGFKTSQIDQAILSHVLKVFSLDVLLNRPFRALSTGETRKLLLARALLQKPKLIILDEPWDGLDQKACEGLTELLHSLSTHMTFMFVLNRTSEIPEYCQQLVLMEHGNIQWQAKVDSNLPSLMVELKQLQHIQQTKLTLPHTDGDMFAPRPLDNKAPLAKLTKVKVQYAEHIVFNNVDWTILPNQHWQLTGPNGSGKTCLLNLISGDHPQCYVNDIFVFGYQRGNGESIWQIKQYIGYMSNAFHLDYRVNCSALQVVLSGFYDSIGLYQTPTNMQTNLAKQWLALMGLDEHAHKAFQQHSFGDQRLLLIVRAMVKHPTLLILDEPCNGLDEINRLKVLALIDLLAREGNTTLLYVNHHPEDVIPSIQNHLSMLDYQDSKCP